MPPEPHALTQALARGATDIGLVLSEAQGQQLCRYVDLLLHWNRVYNLTAVRDADSMLRQHVFDCLAVVPSVIRWSSGRPLTMLDVGSGAGLPGLVLAMLMPESTVTCVDAVGKKASFIRQAAGELGLPNVQALHSRVEAIKGQRFDLVVSRAFASLDDFTRLTRPIARQGATWMAMKGRDPSGEVAGLPSDVDTFHVEHLDVPELDAERCLVWMRAVDARAN